MKSVSGSIFITTISVAIVLVAVSFVAGMKSFAMQHGCTVDKLTKKATCTK